jgi:quercetin dioxygenase-like cupin family protein
MSLEQRRFVTAAEKVDFHSPWTLEEWFCRSDVVPNQDLLMVRANMEAGHSHPFHTHPTREEIIYVLSGRAEQWVGQEHRILGPGEMVLIPKGEPHGTYNPFRERLVFLAILAPAKAAEPGIVDISSEEPWVGIRQKHGLPACQIANEAH